MYKKILLIPTYKPKDNFIELLKKIDSTYFETVVVNDGSGEEFDKIINEVKKYAYVISHNKNCGKGEAIKTGLKHIKENYEKPYIVVTMDCDLQHTIDDAKKVCEEAMKNEETLIIGKRDIRKKAPFRSKIGNIITGWIFFILTKKHLEDTQTGLRAFSNKLIDFLINIDGEKYEYEMNVLLNCSLKNIEINEVEINTIYFKKNEDSHFNSIIDSLRICKKIIKFSISSLTCFFIDYGLYSLFTILSNKIVLSNILARFVSSIVNYNLNKKLVFKNNQKNYKSIVQYFSLAILILLINTSILKLFVDFIGINAYIAKILVETILFVLSYIIQSKIIFRK